MPTETRPIDRTKSSNRRCVNCAEYKNCRKMPVNGPISKALFCEKAQKHVDYWNRCRHFQWDPGKRYTD